MIYDSNKVYSIVHWSVHIVIASLLVFFTNFTLFGTYYLNFDIYGTKVTYHILDYFFIYAVTIIVDLDHLRVLKRYGIEGLLKFAHKRIQYPFHNFFFIAFLSLAAAMVAMADIKWLAVILLAPVLHLLWDMFEDVVIFKTSYRKWEKTWGIGSKDLENLWKEMEKVERAK